MNQPPTDLAPAGNQPTATEFRRIAGFLFDRTGIELKPGKETLVSGRLERRLRHHGLGTFTEYLHLIESGDAHEAQIAVDLLTTNETYFFREPQHFEFLDQLMRERPAFPPVRIWSAASSTGEEAYTIALTLAECLPTRTWEVIGTDISSRVVAAARRGLYAIEAAAKIPQPVLRRHCLRGNDDYDGLFMVEPGLRQRVRFETANLMEPLDHLGDFDVVFLRNVMIYFGLETKRALVRRVEDRLRPGGHLLISHSESLKDLESTLELVGPSIYRKAV